MTATSINKPTKLIPNANDLYHPQTFENTLHYNFPTPISVFNYKKFKMTNDSRNAPNYDYFLRDEIFFFFVVQLRY